MKVDFPADQLLELERNIRKAKVTWCVAGLKLDEYVDVAVGTKVLPQHRSEKKEAADVVPLADAPQRLSVDLHVAGGERAHHAQRIRSCGHFPKEGAE